MKVELIVDRLGPKAPANYSEISFAEITKVYHEMYAGGLSGFFETSWFYFTENGKMSFPREPAVIEAMASFLTMLSSPASSAQDKGPSLDSLETRVVWELARSVCHGSQTAEARSPTALPSWTDRTELQHRFHVVEALLSGEGLTANPLTPPYHDKDTPRVRQFDFWYTLAELIRWRGTHSSPEHVKIREDCLARMRRLLDGRENRDVLYSIAVVREMTPNYWAESERAVFHHLNETDPLSRFVVATRFIAHLTRADGGGTNVIRRICKIAMHAHIDPGVCAIRS